MADDDDDLQVTGDLAIPRRELTWRFTPSGGPGGQHANRSATRAEVVFDVEGSPSLSDAQRARLHRRLGPTVVVAADDHRSQSRNRSLALDRLRSALAEAMHEERPRRPTKATKASKRRRVEQKKQRGETKRLRGKVRPDD